MPTYEYLCSTCSHRFETWQKMTDEPLSICPECGGGIRRVLYPASIVFKGSGFYKTDHSNGNSKAPATNGHGETKSAEKSESKPASENKTSSDSSANGNTTTASAPTTSATTTPK